MTKHKKEDKEIDVYLTEKQLLGLEKLATIDVESVGSNLKKCSWVGRMFQWIDDNILDKTSRLWMYILEALGICIIIVFIIKFLHGLNLIASASTDIEIEKAKLYIDAVRTNATPISAMVATICGALPTVIGVFRALKGKWKNGYGTEKPKKELKDNQEDEAEQEN